MGRLHEDGKRATGVQCKNGLLYVVIGRNVIVNGQKKKEKKWYATGLKDRPENVAKAKRMRENILAQNRPVFIDPKVLFSDYVDIYLAKIKRKIKDSTYATYSYQCDQLSIAFNKIRVREINVTYVEGFFDSLAKKQKSKTYIKDLRKRFKNIMNSAIKDGIITENPVEEAEFDKQLIASNSEKSDETKIFSYKEAIRFLKYAKSKSELDKDTYQDYEMYYFTLFYGLRRQEILGLKWTSIDFREKKININHTVTKGLRTIDRIDSTKSERSKRTLPINDYQINLFKGLKEKENHYRQLVGNSYFDSDYIFKRPDGQLYHPDRITKRFRRLLEQCPDLPQDVTIRGLRASCVSILVHEGFDIKSVQEWVGHEDVSTTMKYYAKAKKEESNNEISIGMSKLLNTDFDDELEKEQ